MITGASGGLGREAAKQFAEAWAKLALSDINENPLKELAEKLQSQGSEVFYQSFDVTSENQVQDFVNQTVASFGKLDVAINPA